MTPVPAARPRAAGVLPLHASFFGPVVLAALALSWPAAAASRQAFLADSLSQVVVTFADLGNSTMRLEGRFTTAAPRATAWSVLTDYDHISAFVASMRSSRVKAHGDGFLLVEQETAARILLFHRTMRVLLNVREQPRQSIAFADVSKASFERYEGSWTLQDTPGGTQVIYQLTAKSGFVGFVARGPSQRMVRELLEQVRAEIDRRAAPRSGCCGPG